MTTPRTSLTVRYNPIMGWAMLTLGVINFVLGLWLLALGIPGITLVLGPLFIVLGVLYLTREYFTYTSHLTTKTIEVVAPIGTRRPYSVRGSGRFVVEGGRIVLVEEPGKRKKLPVMRYMSRRSDWDALVSTLQQ